MGENILSGHYSAGQVFRGAVFSAVPFPPFFFYVFMKGGDLLFITAFRVFSGAVTLKFFLEE